MSARLILGSFIVFFGFAACLTAEPIDSVAAPVVRFQTGDVLLVNIRGDRWVERLTGDMALAHLYNLMSRQPEAFTEIQRSLAEKRFHPTRQVYVERTIRLTHGPASQPGTSIVPVQSYSEQGSEGEIVFWSWDDGNNSTWEGSIYVEVYASGAASTWEGQINASTTEHPWIYYVKTWSRDGNGGPLPTGVDEPPLPGQLTRAVLKYHPGTGAGIALAGWIGWARCWRQCVIAWCAGAAIACLSTGPGWPGCWGAACTGAELACAIGCY